MKTTFVKVILPLIIAVVIGGLGYLGYTLGTTARVITKEDSASQNQSEKIGANSQEEVYLPNKLTGTWVSPKRIDSLHLFKQDTSGSEYFFDIEKTAEYYLLGNVQSGPYGGAELLRIDATVEDGPGGSTALYFIKKQDGQLVYLTRKSAEYALNLAPLVEPNRISSEKAFFEQFPEFMSPKTLTYQGSTFKLDGEEWMGEQPLFESRAKDLVLKEAFYDPNVGQVYMDDHSTTSQRFPYNGFYIATNYGVMRSYTLDIPFFDKSTKSYSITWSGNTKSENVVDYDVTDVGGCGSHNYMSVVNGLEKSELVEIGRASNGDVIYGFKDDKHQMLTSMFDGFNGFYSYGDKKSLVYDEFLAKRPMFFWYDPFGRLIKFQRADFLPAVECGKPVIYLYPEATTTVSVKLSPVGGFSKTEPAYNGGWNVVATPSGELTEVATGKKYPYLFWEGRGGIYETPEEGFVVEQENIHSFLVEKLSQLGLNKKEQDDFIEFWEPRMQAAPYYFVTFMTNNTMNRLAPLSITPTPETVIRVLMDFTPLDKKVKTKEYTIITPKRKGFTVVEWGGVLR